MGGIHRRATPVRSRAACAGALVLLVACVAQAADPPPKLVLFIVVDQLRGDMPARLHDRFGEGGFRALLDDGLWFRNAHFRHGGTFTGVGHAALFTGAAAGEHGVCGNDWEDRATGQRVYCVEDPRHTVLGESPRDHAGTSPANLLVSTLGDELILATAGRSRVVSVAGKDRAAILAAGRLGKAYWYSRRAGGFTTSTFYHSVIPPWVAAHNATRPAEAFRGKSWELLAPRETYLFASRDDAPWEYPFGQMGRAFPHPLDNADPDDFLQTLLHTPFADEMTVACAEAALSAERLGQGDFTDVLAVCLSATDYIGHAFGPDSLEAEDNLLRLDRTLARLLGAVDRAVGLSKTLIVLSSDHGVDSSPELRHALLCPAGAATDRLAPRPDGSVQLRWRADDAPCCPTGRHDTDALLAALNDALRRRFNVDADLARSFWSPCVYLDEAAVARYGLELAAVERAAADALMRLPGFAGAFTRTDLLSGRLPDTDVARRAMRSFHATRSGHVMLIQSSFWSLYKNSSEDAAMHGSPYVYDTYVPILFAGVGVRARHVIRPVSPEQIAVSLALRLGICPPSAAVIEPLDELFESR